MAGESLMGVMTVGILLIAVVFSIIAMSNEG